MRISIDHKLSVTLPGGASQAVFHLLLTPPSGPGQTVESWSVEIPGIGNAGRFTDGFGNTAHLVNQSKAEGEITIRVRGTVTTRDTNGVLGRPGGEPVAALYRRQTSHTKAAPDFAEKYREAGAIRLDILHALMADVGEALDPTDQAEAPAQSQTQSGKEQSQSQSSAPSDPKTSAEDYAHLFIAAARALEIPARYVVGYRIMEEASESGLHAWAEAFDEGLGWIGFDPSARICPTENYVRLAVGLDAETAPFLRTVPVAQVEQAAAVVRA